MAYKSRKYKEPTNPVGTVAELFAGVGGFRIGLAEAGWKTVYSNQWEPSTKTQHASNVYVANFGEEGHSNEDISTVENRLERKSVDGHRTRPDGTDLKWKQLGVLGTLEDSQLPFFIEWETKEHPSIDGKPAAEIIKIEISGDKNKVKNWLGIEPGDAFSGIEIIWIDPKKNDGETGIVSVDLLTQKGVIRLD